MKVVIVGAGATGMGLAYLLAKTGHQVEMIEATDQPGGLLRTFPVTDTSRLEYFYHHFFTHDVELNWLLDELGLADEILYRPSSMGVYRNGKIFPFNGMWDLAKFSAMSLTGRFRFGLTSALLALREKYTQVEDCSALEWFRKYAGRDATESIWRPMMESKFGNDADQIPLAWIAGRLRQRALSRKRGVEQLGYLKGSLQVLTDELERSLAGLGVRLRLKSPVQSIDTTDGKPTVTIVGGKQITGDKLVITTPTSLTARWFQDSAPTYSNQLSDIQYLGAICTLLSFPKKLSSTYWLNVADPGFDFGGVIEQTNLVNPSEYGDQHLVYLSKYVALDDPLLQLSDEQLVSRQTKQLEKLYRRPLRQSLQDHWVFRTRSAAPLTDLGFRSRVPKFRTPISNVFVGSMCHLYPEERSVNNSLCVAAEIAAEMGFEDAAKLIPRGMSTAGTIGRGPGLAPEQEFLPRKVA